MRTFNIKGKIIEVGEAEKITDKFTKRVIRIDAKGDNDKYPNPIEFVAANDNCDMLKGKRKGDEVEIAFSIQGRTWDSPKSGTRYFTDLRIITIAVTGSEKTTEDPVDDGGDDPF